MASRVWRPDRPVTVASADYAWSEYGAPPAELAQCGNDWNSQITAERTRGKTGLALRHLELAANHGEAQQFVRGF